MSETQYKIESNIPMPTGRMTKWDFVKDMEVGQSFVCLAAERPAVHQIAKKLGWKITSRRLPRKDSSAPVQARVWRKS